MGVFWSSPICVSSSPLIVCKGCTLQQVLPEMFCCWSFQFPRNMFVLSAQAAFQNISDTDSTSYTLTVFQLQSISSRVFRQYQDGIVQWTDIEKARWQHNKQIEVIIMHPRCAVSRSFPVAAPVTGVPQNHRFCQRSQVKLHGVKMALTFGEHGVGLSVRACKGSGLPPSYGLARATHIPVQSSLSSSSFFGPGKFWAWEASSISHNGSWVCLGFAGAATLLPCRSLAWASACWRRSHGILTE